MKKITIVITLIIIALLILKSETIIIPKESIRFRVIANSNTEKDQNIKKAVVKNLEEEISNLEIVPKNILSTRKAIQSNIPMFKKSVEETLKELNVEQDYTIQYGMNYFPNKEYKGVTYEEGEYESLIIKLGDGMGDNFWCVLFPPLCLLETEETEKDDVEYTSFIKEIIDKYF